MSEILRAEMVASVQQVLVGVGDRVDSGQQLIILESMKMEIPVLAETNGVVSQVAVAVGDVVQEGDVLVVTADP